MSTPHSSQFQPVVRVGGASMPPYTQSHEQRQPRQGLGGGVPSSHINVQLHNTPTINAAGAGSNWSQQPAQPALIRLGDALVTATPNPAAPLHQEAVLLNVTPQQQQHTKFIQATAAGPSTAPVITALPPGTTIIMNNEQQQRQPQQVLLAQDPAGGMINVGEHYGGLGTATIATAANVSTPPPASAVTAFPANPAFIGGYGAPATVMTLPAVQAPVVDASATSSSKKKKKRNKSTSEEPPRLTIHGDVAFADGDDTNLIVNYIPVEVKDKELGRIFSRFGPLSSSRVIKDSKGYPRGYGFVKYSAVEDAMKALEGMSGFEIAGKRLKVNIARPTGAVVIREGKVVDLGGVPEIVEGSCPDTEATMELLKEQQQRTSGSSSSSAVQQQQHRPDCELATPPSSTPSTPEASDVA